MSNDIAAILAAWPYDPDRVSVRLIRDADGRERVQLRLDLGLLQMEVSGRPDGQKIEGRESWLEYFQQQQKTHDTAHPDGPPFRLESDDCGKLLREGVQYYHRYLSFWYLKRYEWCARDTARNLRLFTFVREHARHQHDRLQFDQWYPYVTMMHTRAVATPLAELRQYDAALSTIAAGIRGIEEFLELYEQLERADSVGELVFLKRWQRELQALVQPPSQEEAARQAAHDPIERLRAQLSTAIAAEDYEEAGRLRDELARLTNPPPPATGLGEVL